MAIKNSRVTITFDKETVLLFVRLAEQRDQSVSSLVRELVVEGLAMREDLYLSTIAQQLDTQGAITYDHDNAWK